MIPQALLRRPPVGGADGRYAKTYASPINSHAFSLFAALYMALGRQNEARSDKHPNWSCFFAGQGWVGTMVVEGGDDQSLW